MVGSREWDLFCGAWLLLGEVIKRGWQLVDPPAHSRQPEAPHHLPPLQVSSAHHLHSGSHFKDAPLWESSIVKTIWTEAVKASMQTFKIWQMGEEIYSSWGTWHNPCMWVLLPITPATCQSGGVCFFFWTLIALCVWELVSDFPPTPAPREHLNLQANKFCQSVVRERKLLFSHNLGSDMGAVLYHFLCDETVLEPIWGHRLYLLMGIMSKNVWLSFTCNLC